MMTKAQLRIRRLNFCFEFHYLGLQVNWQAFEVLFDAQFQVPLFPHGRKPR